MRFRREPVDVAVLRSMWESSASGAVMVAAGSIKDGAVSSACAAVTVSRQRLENRYLFIGAVSRFFKGMPAASWRRVMELK